MEPTNHPFRKENDLPNLHDVSDVSDFSFLPDPRSPATPKANPLSWVTASRARYPGALGMACCGLAVWVFNSPMRKHGNESLQHIITWTYLLHHGVFGRIGNHHHHLHHGVTGRIGNHHHHLKKQACETVHPWNWKFFQFHMPRILQFVDY